MYTPLLPLFCVWPVVHVAFDSYLHSVSWPKFVPLFSPLAAEEKKSLKRTFQQIQEEEDDDYPGSYSPQDPSAGPLLVCLGSQRLGQSGFVAWPLVEDCGHKVALGTHSTKSPEGSSQGTGCKVHPGRLARQQACLRLCMPWAWMDLCLMGYLDLGFFHS